MVMDDLGSQILGDQGVGPEPVPVEMPDAPVDDPTNDPIDDPIDEPAPVAAEPYQPDLNYNIHDQKHEFPEAVRGFVQNKETETYFRDLLERAHGLDVVKNDRQVLRDREVVTTKELDTYKNNYQQLGQQVQAGDLDSFHKQWGITEEALVNHVMQKVRMSDPELDPQMRQQMVAEQDLRQQNANLTHQVNQLQQQTVQSTMSDRLNDLDRELSNPNIATVAQEFDQRAGQHGAFRERVIKMGASYGPGTDVPANQAIQETMRFMGMAPASAQPAQTYGQPQPQFTQPNVIPQMGQPAQPAVTQRQQLPVIPVIPGGGAQSPARALPRSIADLRELGRQANS